MMLLVALLVPGVLGQMKVKKTVVSTRVLGMETRLFSTFPYVPDYECDIYDATPLDQPVFWTHILKFKEYDDGSTTMDLQATTAGAAVGIGVFDYVGWGVDDLYDQLPVTNDLDVYLANPTFSAQFGFFWNYTMLIEIFRDAPVYKYQYNSSYFGGPVTQYSVNADLKHMPQPHLIIQPLPGTFLNGTDFLAYQYSTGYRFRFIQTDDDIWTMELHDVTSLFSTHLGNPYDVPSSIFSVFGGKDDILNWHQSGNGTYGGLGSPPLLHLNASMNQTYI